MSRAPRTTKCQKEYIVNFLEQNKILVSGKVNPFQLTKVNQLWEKMVTELNKMGPSKSIKAWKDVSINE